MGRETELEAVQRHLARAASGKASVLLLEGEPGIGKSRLLAEALDLAERAGFSLLQGTADELNQNRPFGILADALDISSSSSDPKRAALAQLLASDGAGQSLARATPLAPGVLMRAVERILELLEETAARDPVLLALDDLHWADTSSLLVVRAVSRRLTRHQVALLCTLRPSPRAPELDRLLEVLVEAGATRVSLPPLDEAAVSELVGQVLGAMPGPALLNRIAGAAGNPLYALELIWALLDEDVVEVVEGWAQMRSRSLPSAFIDLVLRRLRSLTQPTWEALQVASVLGPSFSLTDLSAVLDRPVTALMGFVREAMAARLVKESEAQGPEGNYTFAPRASLRPERKARGGRLPGGKKPTSNAAIGDAGRLECSVNSLPAPHLAFRHPLVQEAVYEQIPLTLRSSLHRQVGRALADLGSPSPRIAHHLVRGAMPGDTDAVSWLERAAREIAPHAPGTAADLLARALELVDSSDPRHVELLSARAVSLVLAGRPVEGQVVASQALARCPGPVAEAETRLGLGRSLLVQGREQDAVDQLAAAACLPSLGDSLRAELWAEASVGRLICGDLAAAAEQAERAAALGEAAGNRLATCAALCTLAMVAYYRADFAAAVSFGRRAVQEAESDPGGPAGQHHPWFFLGIALMSVDRFDDAKQTFEAGSRLADELGTHWGLPLYHMGLAMQHFHRGTWNDAVAELEAAVAYGEDTDCRAGLIWVYSCLCEVAIHRDDLAAAEAVLADAERALAASGVRLGAEGLLTAQAHLRRAHGDADGALALLEQAWDVSMAVGMLSEAGGPARLLVPLACAAGRRDLAREVTEVLEGIAARCPWPRFHGDALRCRGWLTGDPQLFLQAVAAYRGDPRPLLLAEALEDAGTVLGRAGRAAEARPPLEEALAIHERLEARRNVARLHAALRSIGVRKGRRGPRQRPKRGWSSLTVTELDVVRHVADGLSNARIGERLFISRRTVDTHLSHVFDKLGLSSRRELARIASERLSTAPDGPPTVRWKGEAT